MVKTTQYRYLGLQSSMIKLLKHQLIKIMRKREGVNRKKENIRHVQMVKKKKERKRNGVNQHK
jgi:hypothetical protein